MKKNSCVLLSRSCATWTGNGARSYPSRLVILRPQLPHPNPPLHTKHTNHITTTPTMPLTFLRRLLRPSLLTKSPITALPLRTTATRTAFSPIQPTTQTLLSTPSRAHKCTLIQVLRNGRGTQSARKLRSPQLKNRPELKGVCLKVGTTKPKKPNSGERKIARVRLSTGKVITAYIPGEGMF